MYNEAGRMCLELTEKYTMLEDLRMTTKLSDMKHCLCKVQAEKLLLRRRADERITKQKSQMKAQPHPIHHTPIHHSVQPFKERPTVPSHAA